MGKISRMRSNSVIRSFFASPKNEPKKRAPKKQLPFSASHQTRAASTSCPQGLPRARKKTVRSFWGGQPHTQINGKSKH